MRSYLHKYVRSCGTSIKHCMIPNHGRIFDDVDSVRINVYSPEIKTLVSLHASERGFADKEQLPSLVSHQRPGENVIPLPPKDW